MKEFAKHMTMSASNEPNNGSKKILRTGESLFLRYHIFGEFDPGSGRTLAARLTHASRTGTNASVFVSVADG